MNNRRKEISKEIKAERRNSEKYKKHIRYTTVIVFVLFLVLSTALSLPLVRDLRTEAGMERMAERLESYSGPVGMMVFVFIQALQVVIAVIPPVQIIGGVLFGWFFGTILSFAGIVLGNLLIFVIVGKFGRPIAEAFVDEKHFKRFSFLKDEKKLTRLLMLLYIIPGIPKDILSYLVPLTKISRRDFFMYVMPCRIPAILLTTIMGSNAVSGNYKTAIVLLAVSALLGIIGFVFKEPLMRKLNKRRSKTNTNNE